jgi:hypothetical protein
VVVGVYATVVVVGGGRGAVVGAEVLWAWVGEDVIEGGGGVVPLDEDGGVVVVDVLLRRGGDG